MTFNDSQLMAINHIEGPCLVVAGPGSGKTAVITKRVSNLIRSGVPASEILVITFTKAAAIEMKERFKRASDGNHSVTFGTFHSLFWGILQKECGYKTSDIVMGAYRDNIIREAMELAYLDKDDLALVNGVASAISVFGNGVQSIEEFEPEMLDKTSFALVYNNYCKLKTKYKVVDFDDMLSKAYELFMARKDVLSKWQNRFSYYLVDEMQDMNDLQFKLIKMLSDRTKNIFCVGDDDQSIYGFRGANPRIMSDFVSNYEDTKRVLLNYNYRNPSNIVTSGQKLIGANENRFSKDIIATNEEGQINISNHLDEIAEAEFICQAIMAEKEKGVPLEEISILFRNHTDVKFLVNKLIEHEIPFYMKESLVNYYSHFIIQDIEAYFQIAIGNSTRARLLRIINRPNRFLHRAALDNGSTIDALKRFYQNNPAKFGVIEAMWADLILISKMTPFAALNYIRKVIGYDNFLRQEALRNNAEYEEYNEILEFLAELLKDCKNIKQAIDKINMMRYKIDFENKNKCVDKNNKVGLLTLHSSKGLEFHTVFIISANEGIIPSNKAETKDELEGERRLFYVGITRTKRNLFITYTNKKNRDKSRFLDEMKIEDYSMPSSSQISSNFAATASYSSSD